MFPGQPIHRQRLLDMILDPFHEPAKPFLIAPTGYPGTSNSPYSFILGLMSVFSCFGTGNRRFQTVCTACRCALERVPGIDMQVS